MIHVIITGTGMVRVPTDRGGAIEAYIYDLASMLSDRGHSVSLVSDIRKLPEKPRWSVVPVRSPFDRFPMSPVLGSVAHAFGGFQIYRAARGYVSATPQDVPTVLHINEEVSGACLVHAVPNVPKVYTLHNPPPALGSGKYGRVEHWLRHLGSLWNLRFIVRRMTTIVALNSVLREFLIRDWKVDPERVVHLPLPIDTSVYSPRKEERPDGPTHLLYVGRLDARKNVATLLRVLPRLDRNVRLTLVGDGPLHSVVRTFISSKGLGGRVNLLPKVTVAELVELYRSADLLVHPSPLEVYPRTVVEAAACGVPVVLPNLPIYRDFLRQGFASPYSIDRLDTLRDAIEQLHQDASLRRELGQQGRAYAVRNNSYPSFSSRLLTMYRGVVQ